MGWKVVSESAPKPLSKWKVVDESPQPEEQTKSKSIMDSVKESVSQETSPQAILKRLNPMLTIQMEAEGMKQDVIKNMVNTLDINNKLSDERVFSKESTIGKLPIIGSVTPRSMAKEAEAQAINLGIDAITGSGLKLASVGKDFLKSRSFKSNTELMDELFVLKSKILKEASNAIGKKSSNEAVREVANTVGNSKTPIEARIKIEGVAADLFARRDKVLIDNNSIVNSKKHINDLESYLKSEDAIKEMTKEQRTGANNFLQQAKDELVSLGGKFDRLVAQKLKSKYQDVAIYEREADALIQGKAIAARKMAYSLRDTVTSGLPEQVKKIIDGINSRYSGLKEGLELFEGLESQFKVDPSKFKSGFKSWVRQTIRPTKSSAIAAAFRESPRLIGHGSFESTTSNMSKLTDKYKFVENILSNRLNKQAGDSIQSRILSNTQSPTKMLPDMFTTKHLPQSEQVLRIGRETGFKMSEPPKPPLQLPEYTGPTNVIPAGRTGNVRSTTKSFGDLEGEQRVKQALKSRRHIKPNR